MSSLSAHADQAWVSTSTQAAMSPVATTRTLATTSSASVPMSGYILNMTGSPHVDAAAVSAMPGDHPLQVTVAMKVRDPDALKAFLAAVTTPGNALYGKFLTPAEFKARFAPTQAQVDAVVAHLRQSGFDNIEVAPNNMLISASGTAAAAATGFHTSIKRINANGRERFANDTPALVPASLGDSVGSVLGLQNVSVKHTLHHVYQPDNVTAPGPATRTQASGSVTAHQPQDFASIYGGSSVPAATNTTVAVITWGSLTQTVKDLNTFTSNAGLATVNATITKVGSGTFANDPNSNGEWSLDSQDIVGIAGGVKQLIFYTSPNGDTNSSGITDAGITATYNKAVTDNFAKLINVSLGEDETAAQQSGTQQADDNIFQQAVAQGQIFSVAAGDAGVYQWSSDPIEGAPGYVANSAGTVKIDLTHYSVSEPASSPYVIQVGGTTLSTSGTSWGGETVWNEGLATIDPGNDSNQRLWATGGGTSLYETAPSWQSSVSSSGNRVGPDVAFDAASSSGALIVINGQSGQQVGGTSLASPLFVGAFARIESAANNGIGFPASKFYQAFPTQTSVLHDVTSGNNGYQGHGEVAGTGFDQATGFGSFDIGKLNTYAQANWVSGGNTGGGGSGSTSPNSLQNGVAKTGLSATTGNKVTGYYVTVPAGATNLKIAISGGTGDADLYVKFGSAPTTSSYGCRPYLTGNSESCTFASPQAGTYYVMVNAYQSFSGVSLKATWTP
ncbi:pre-peptidase C-terminal domain-containing protein [Luteibacter sp. CQ10]